MLIMKIFSVIFLSVGFSAQAKDLKTSKERKVASEAPYRAMCRSVHTETKEGLVCEDGSRPYNQGSDEKPDFVCSGNPAKPPVQGKYKEPVYLGLNFDALTGTKLNLEGENRGSSPPAGIRFFGPQFCC